MTWAAATALETELPGSEKDMPATEPRGGGGGAPLVAQLVKNPPAVQETPVGFLGWDNVLEKG